MDTFIYFSCGLLTVLWSGWLFIFWRKRAGLSDTSLWRFILVLLPVTVFILVAFNDWSSFIFLRVDLIALIGIALINLLCWLVQLACVLLAVKVFRPIFLVSAILSLVASVVLIVFVYLLRANPLLAVRLSTFLESWQSLDWLKVFWEGLDPEKNQETVYNLVNKILIALGIYIPMTAVRIWHTNKKFKQLKGEIDGLKAGIEELRETRSQLPVATDPGDW